MKRMVRRTYLPAINLFASDLAAAITSFKAVSAGANTRQQEMLLDKLLNGIDEIDRALEALGEAHSSSLEIADEQQRADFNAHTIIPLMEQLRAAVDAMEVVTGRDRWPVPSYNNLLFYV